MFNKEWWIQTLSYDIVQISSLPFLKLRKYNYIISLTNTFADNVLCIHPSDEKKVIVTNCNNRTKVFSHRNLKDWAFLDFLDVVLFCFCHLTRHKSAFILCWHVWTLRYCVCFFTFYFCIIKFDDYSPWRILVLENLLSYHIDQFW